MTVCGAGAAALAVLMGGSGFLHLVRPEPYARIVPPALGSPSFWVLASGVAELAVAALLLPPRTRRLGATACIVLLVAVSPANVHAALEGGYQGFRPPFDSAAAAWLRLPLQLVLIWWAWRVRRAAE